MSDKARSLLQIMGPEDSYLMQYSNSVGSFWAEGHALELGATFQSNAAPPKSRLPKVGMSQFLVSQSLQFFYKKPPPECLNRHLLSHQIHGNRKIDSRPQHSSASSSSLCPSLFSLTVSSSLQEEFTSTVIHGYQASQTWHQGISLHPARLQN